MNVQISDDIEQEVLDSNGPEGVYCTKCGSALFKEDRPGICSTCINEHK